MLKKFSSVAMFVLVFLCFGCLRAKASDWPAINYSAANNNYIADSSILNAQPEAPKSLEVPYNAMGQIIAEDKLFFSDGLASSTVYAYDLPSLELVWSKQFAAQITNLVYASGNIYLGAGGIYCLSAVTGDIGWSVPVTTGYKAKVLQVDSGVVYAIRWNNNINFLLAVSQNNGQTLGSPTNVMIDSVNEIVLTSNTIYLTAARYNAGGSTLVSFDRATYQYLGSSVSCRSSSATTYDAEQNIVYITATDGALCAYNAASLAPIFPGRMFAMSRLVKYGDTMYSVYGRNIQYFQAKDKLAVVSNYTNVLDSPSTFQGHPIVVNGILYANANDGQLMAKNLESGELKFYDIDSTMLLQRIIYGSGQFVLTGANNGKKKFYVYNYANLGAKPVSGAFSVTSPYHTEGMNQYLGQLHAHIEPERPCSNCDPLITPRSPAEVELRYKKAGYKFISLTEHNVVLPNPAVTGILHIENSEEITQGLGGDHILALGINFRILPSGTDQGRIDQVVFQGGIPVLAHPNSRQYPFSSLSLLDLMYYKHLEIINNALEFWKVGSVFSGSSLSLDKLDVLLYYGKTIFGTGGDDYTPFDGGFDGAAVEVFSQSYNQSDIMANLKTGNFYALQGSKAPRINSLVTNASGLSLEVSEPSDISFIGKGGITFKKEKNVTSASYIFQGDEIYVRAEVEAVNSGLKAWTQAVVVAPTQEEISISPGVHTTLLNQAVLNSNAAAPVLIKIINKNDYPEQLPPSGYLSPIYQFSTEGKVLAGNKLSISYANREIPVDASNLAIFTYDEAQKRWVKNTSTIDQINQIVTTELPHYSLYALSTSMPEDTEAPTVSLSIPTNLDDLTGTVVITAAATDNQAVTEVKFIIDSKEISSDIISSDGWSTLLDTSVLTNGSHKLTLSAEDFSGNKADRSYDINISGGITAPTISITTPATTDFLYEPSKTTGIYTSQLDVEEIGIYLDDVFIEKAEINTEANIFSGPIDWTKVREGMHKLKLELRDKGGNTATAEIDVTVKQNVISTIISPTDKTYLRASALPITVITIPATAAINIFFDNTAISNNTSLDLLNYSLGSHSIEVKFGDKVVAFVSFEITTNYQDTVDIVKRFENEGHFTNHGIPSAIIVQLHAAEIAGKLRCAWIEKLLLQNLISFIKQQSANKKPKIDRYGRTILMGQVLYLLK